MIDLSVPDNSEYDKGRGWIHRALWYFIGSPIMRCYWMPLSCIRTAMLRLFGAAVGKGVYIKPGVQIKFPWHLEVGDHCWIGEGVWIDNLAHVTIGSNVCLSQGVYLCTGNHDWTTRNLKLFVRPIVLHDGCWVGAKTVLCPGAVVKEGAILAAGSVAAKEIPMLEVWAGNPARYRRNRLLV